LNVHIVERGQDDPRHVPPKSAQRSLGAVLVGIESGLKNLAGLGIYWQILAIGA
jgi:hypothetical protein